MLLGRSLDDWRLCEADDCGWHCLEPQRRCSDHGGDVGPEYWEDREGDILATRHMNLLEAQDNDDR